jgi:hypothetical protein
MRPGDFGLDNLTNLSLPDWKAIRLSVLVIVGSSKTHSKHDEGLPVVAQQAI